MCVRERKRERERERERERDRERERERETETERDTERVLLLFLETLVAVTVLCSASRGQFQCLSHSATLLAYGNVFVQSIIRQYNSTPGVLIKNNGTCGNYTASFLPTFACTWFAYDCVACGAVFENCFLLC